MQRVGAEGDGLGRVPCCGHVAAAGHPIQPLGCLSCSTKQTLHEALQHVEQQRRTSSLAPPPTHRHPTHHTQPTCVECVQPGWIIGRIGRSIRRATSTCSAKPGGGGR